MSNADRSFSRASGFAGRILLIACLLAAAPACPADPPASPAGRSSASALRRESGRPEQAEGESKDAERPDDLAARPRVYIPYAELAAVIDPSAKNVLMERDAFARLLAAARAAAAKGAGKPVGQFTRAAYRAAVAEERMDLTGELTLVSLSDQPVEAPFGFAGAALGEVLLDGRPAPLGFDEKGRTVLIVTGRGEHTVKITATASLETGRSAGGGRRLALALPPAVSGTMKLHADGDVEVVSGAAVTDRTYDAETDRTTARLAVGGQRAVTLALLGNGRRDADEALLVFGSTCVVSLSPSHETISCLCDVEILRRAVRTLRFRVDADWTVTAVRCPEMTRWSLGDPSDGTRTLKVELARALRGSRSLHIAAEAKRSGTEGEAKDAGTWRSPRLELIGADYAHGYLVVDPATATSDLRIRNERLTRARRALRRGAGLGILAAGGSSRLYYHWGKPPAGGHVQLELTELRAERSAEAHQELRIGTESLRLTSRWTVDALASGPAGARQIYELTVRLPDKRWSPAEVHVNGKTTGFRFRELPGEGGPEGDPGRRLVVELDSPARRVELRVVLTARPGRFFDRELLRAGGPTEDAPAAAVTVRPAAIEAEKVSGVFAVRPAGDLEVTVADDAKASVPEAFRRTGVGRMAELGLDRAVRIAWTYRKPLTDATALRLSAKRTSARLAATAVGLATISREGVDSHWRLRYNVTRSRTRTFYFLADKRAGRTLRIDLAAAQGARLTERKIVEPGPETAELPEGAAEARWNLWRLTLDAPVSGQVTVDVRLRRPAEGRAVPLVLPVGARPSTAQLALAASEELAVEAEASDAEEIDAIELPALPAPARRILAAWRLGGPGAKVTVSTTRHEPYGVPGALAGSAELTTYLGADGAQRTEATYRLVNATMQFLDIRLPADAELWSVVLDGEPAKPRKGPSTKGMRSYLVPIGRWPRPRAVKVICATGPRAHPGRVRTLRLVAPALAGVEVNRSRWRVVPPPGTRISGQKTLMEPDAPLTLPPAWEELLALTTLMARSVGEGVERAQEVELHSESVAPPASPDPDAPAPPRDRAAAGEAMPDESDAGKDENKQRVQEREAKRSRQARAVQPADSGFQYGGRVEGRYTLPVELGEHSSPHEVTFRSLGAPALVIELSPARRFRGWMLLGAAVVAAVGLWLLRASPAAQFGWVFGVLLIGGLVSFWIPATRAVLNGAFLGACALAILYLLYRPVARLTGRVVRTCCARRTAAAATLLAAGLAWTAGTPTLNAEEPATPPDPNAWKTGDRQGNALIVPYDGDPTEATKAQKVLVPYRRYARLWNLAHPDNPLAEPSLYSGAAVSEVRYVATLSDETLRLTLTAGVRTFGRGTVRIPLPIGNLAIAEATFAGKPASVSTARTTAPLRATRSRHGGQTPPPSGSGSAGPDGGANQAAPPAKDHPTDRRHELRLPAGTSGTLRIEMVTTPKRLGRTGRVSLALPPLPAATLRMVLPDEDLILDLPTGQAGVESPPAAPRRDPDNPKAWTLGLGTARFLTLRWSPRPDADGGAASVMTAESAHDVKFYHWGVFGVSRLTWRFSGAPRGRFAFAAPGGLTVTAVTGADLAGWSPSERGDGLYVARLHRPAAKSQTLTIRWMRPLPATGEPTGLELPRPAGVKQRERGRVTLWSVGGLELKAPADAVRGGRRASLPPRDPSPLAGTARGPSPVVRYAWPYRPFGMKVAVRRPDAERSAEVDQLVRISDRRVQLLARATVTAEQGRLFGVSFALPDGYELLSAAGPEVFDWYVQQDALRRGAGRPAQADGEPKDPPAGQAGAAARAHVSFRRAVRAATVTLVLVREDPQFATDALRPGSGRPEQANGGRFAVPQVRVLGPDGKPAEDQSGRLGVQIIPALEAKTVSAARLRAVRPESLRGWLGADQASRVRYAYTYDAPTGELTLHLRPLPTTIAAEVLTAAAVGAGGAEVAVRIRYRISGSPVDTLSIRLPAALDELVSVHSPAMRSVSQAPVDAPRGNSGRPDRAGGGSKDGRLTEWTVALTGEMTGIVDVTVNFHLPIDAGTTMLAIPPVKVPAAGEYAAVVAVQNLSRHELSVGELTGLRPLSRAARKRILPDGAQKGLRFAWRGFSDGAAAVLKITPGAAARRTRAVVDLLELTTVIDRAGRCRTEARVVLQNRSEQYLRLRLPDGLTLWSAEVAGRAVRPVRPSDGSGAVLIPLVKTSPGGLPYDVRLHFAGRCVKPLRGLTRPAPEAPRIVGIDVRRTTWSLRLPRGYRYVRPEGMSPVAGTAEMTLIALNASLEQQKRFLDVYDSASLGDRGRKIAESNWLTWNRRVEQKRKKLRGYFAANRDRIDRETYWRLTGELSEQQETQQQLQTRFEKTQRSAARRARGQLNAIVNATATNVGASELDRNKALLQVPHFVRRAEAARAKNLQKNLQSLTTDLGNVNVVMRQLGRGDVAEAGRKLRDASGNATLNITGPVDDGFANSPGGNQFAVNEKERLQAVAGQLKLEQKRILDKQQALQGQIATLSDNRLNRYFESINATKRPRTKLQVHKAPSRQPAVDTTVTTPTARSREMLTGNVEEPGSGGLFRSDAPVEMGVVPGGGPAGGHVAGAAFSLPVALPDGAVRLDFAAPGGAVKLAFYAVPEETAAAGYGTVALLVSAAVVLVLALLARKFARTGVARVVLIVAEVLLVGVALLVGPKAFLAALGLVALVDLLRRRAAPDPAGN